MFGGDIDDYKPINLLKIELKILARVLVNRLQLIISDVVGPEHNYAVKGRSILENLHLVRQILEGIKDDTEASLINLDQSKAFDRIDHRFLAVVLETAGFKPEFHKWISILYHNPQAVVQVNGRRSGAFVIKQSVRQGCPLSILHDVLALKPLLRRLRDRGARPALRGILLSGSVRTKISAFADDITVSVSRRQDIVTVKEAVARYEKVAGAKVHIDKTEGLRFGGWGAAFPCKSPSAGVTVPSASLGCGSGPASSWSEIGWKYGLR